MRSRLLAPLLLAGAVLSAGAARSAPPASAGPAIAVLHYDGGGDWYANPSALTNLLAEARRRTGIDFAERPATVRLDGAALRDYPYLYLTGHGNIRLAEPDVGRLRAYLADGGFLHADDNYGLDESFRREMARVFPDADWVELPPEHAVYHSFYDLEGLPKVHEHDGAAPQGLGLFHAGRLVVFYSFESDLGDGWEDADVHGDSEDVREAAFRMGVNLLVFVLGQAAG
ncbi:MAG TPA: DUF4159 domain-containing protein [Longimicrobiales bacterium]|nr:DUF4159 domain-containing protein [Longimicrobiales bacterium]